uniref:Uncharacterized protein n=1 Tax=Minutocellus polymorphus TaxID=265543 RepID=A0A7S0ACX6_9STRA|mmetsp:Transcript_1104/g.1914  ORF Transcript_1104/g.1914 Transcript_1104/m.1914 type:complete len:244 (+) Transcript_1104:127-858(+)
MPKNAAAASPARADGSASAASKKKAKKGGDTKDETTPYDKYFKHLTAFQDKHDFLGQMLIKGVSRSGGGDSDDEDYDAYGSDDEEAFNAKLTDEQMAGLRFVLITQNRSDQLDAMREYVLGDQANDGILMFNTSFSYGIHDGFYLLKSGMYAKKAKTSSQKFDLLFAYTYTLKEYDVWMHDNEGDMEDMVKDLAKLWKKLLSQDDSALGIDAEYTRPGVLALLEQFKDKVEDVDHCSFKFKYN